jgi:putative transposase
MLLPRRWRCKIYPRTNKKINRFPCPTMANTYTQIYIHVVFAVQGRQNLIGPEHKDELQKYITGIVSGKDQKLIAINNMPDHFHLLIGLKPTMALSELVGEIKSSSSGFINKRRWFPGKFQWQEGFGAFSYSHSQLTTVIRYIQNQEKHHARKTFREEYLEMLQRFQVSYDERYIFRDLDV